MDKKIARLTTAPAYQTADTIIKAFPGDGFGGDRIFVDGNFYVPEDQSFAVKISIRDPGQSASDQTSKTLQPGQFMRYRRINLMWVHLASPDGASVIEFEGDRQL